MTIAWIDGRAGASGDMLLGALVAAGVPLEVLQTSIDHLSLGITLREEAVERGGLGATRVHVDVPDTSIVRHLRDVVAMFDELPDQVRQTATAIFERLAAAEAHVHHTDLDNVHFHEVGALDSIADVVAAVAGFEHLGLDMLYCSPLSLGSGQTSGAHGPIPIPAPAVLQLLTGIAPVQAGPAPFESTTPTGAAILAELVDGWSSLPSILVEATGVGAGAKDSHVVANAVRLVVGQAPHVPESTEVMQLETNIDDIDPRVWPSAIEKILAAGAQDVWITPITMKKGRPAFTLSALFAIEDGEAVRSEVFRQTSTIGLREFSVRKHALNRTQAVVEVDGHRIRTKQAFQGQVLVNESIEWEDVIAAANALSRPATDVLRQATGELTKDDRTVDEF